VSESFKNEDLTTMRDLENYYRDSSQQSINMYSILIRAQVRRRLCELLYPVMTEVLKHGKGYDSFDERNINFTEPPQVHTVRRNVTRNAGRDVLDTGRTTAEDVSYDHDDLPDLNIIFGDDVIERQQITNFNWMSNATLTVSYYRHTYLNPEYDVTTGSEEGYIYKDDNGEYSRLPYDSVDSGEKLYDKNRLIEDLEVACLLFDLEIQRNTQVLPYVTDINLENVTYAVPNNTDLIYGSVEMEYNVNYHTDYKCLERKK